MAPKIKFTAAKRSEAITKAWRSEKTSSGAQKVASHRSAAFKRIATRPSDSKINGPRNSLARGFKNRLIAVMIAAVRARTTKLLFQSKVTPGINEVAAKSAKALAARAKMILPKKRTSRVVYTPLAEASIVT